MITVKHYTVKVPATARSAYRLNLTPLLPELAEVKLWNQPADLHRWLELHSESIEVLEGGFVPGGTYTLVVAELDDIVLYGYVHNDQYRWSTVIKGSIACTIHTAPQSYRDMFCIDSDGDLNADLPYKQNPNALLVGVDAKPLLDIYALVDNRFVLMQGRYITPCNHRKPLNYIFDVFQQTVRQYRDNLQCDNPITTPVEYEYPRYILERLNKLFLPGKNEIVFTKLDSSVEFIEAATADEATIDYCLATLTDPSITYDEDLWLHNVDQVEQLLNVIANTNP